jgi:hypothetical protein
MCTPDIDKTLIRTLAIESIKGKLEQLSLDGYELTY